MEQSGKDDEQVHGLLRQVNLYLEAQDRIASVLGKANINYRRLAQAGIIYPAQVLKLFGGHLSASKPLLISCVDGEEGQLRFKVTSPEPGGIRSRKREGHTSTGPVIYNNLVIATTIKNCYIEVISMVLECARQRSLIAAQLAKHNFYDDTITTPAQPQGHMSVSGSGTEAFEDLFGPLDDLAVESKPQSKLVTYTRPSSGEQLTVSLVRKHVLWGHFLWNGGRWMSDYIDAHPERFAGKRVVEFGAGAGLPSILAAMQGAARVVVTDYPDAELLENIQTNINLLIKEEDFRQNVSSKGFLWGSKAEELLEGGPRFNVVLMLDLIFNHSEHRKLLQSCVDTLAKDGEAWCVFSHYRPWLKDRDLNFLKLAAEEFGFMVEKVAEKAYDEIVVEEARADPRDLRTVYAYRFTFAQIEGRE